MPLKGRQERLCTWPKSNGDETAVPGMAGRSAGSKLWLGPGAYFDEAMNGFEYQVAAHMIWEGMLEKGLATARAVHDRYNASLRNPYNEIECSDHYSRSMASYGVLLAVCGFDYHGPKGYLKFDPKLTPDNFKAPFTVAEGWGNMTQKRFSDWQENLLELNYGSLRLNKFSVRLPDGAKPESTILKLNNVGVNADGNFDSDGNYSLVFEELLNAGDILQLQIKF